MITANRVNEPKCEPYFHILPQSELSHSNTDSEM